MTPEEADAAQDWKGMDGTTAFMLIQRHADSWDDVHLMMDAWFRANTAELSEEVQRLRKGEYICHRCGLRKDAEHDGQPEF